MKTAALIPCRTGSKEIPGKNFKEIAGKPLWVWTYEAALESGIFDMILLSSDGGFGPIEENKITVLDNERHKSLATDEASLDGLLFHYSSRKKYKDIELWGLLQVTSPLRTAKDIKKAHKMVLREKWDSLVSVTHNPVMGWVEDATSEGHVCLYHYNERPNRDRRKHWFLENGAIYFAKDYVLEAFRCRIGGQIALYKMPQERSIEIDSKFDWELANFLLEKGK
jgi:CMP-N-acetylneuraminic acid synthetase